MKAEDEFGLDWHPGKDAFATSTLRVFKIVSYTEYLRSRALASYGRE